MNGTANIIHSSAWVRGVGVGIPGFKTRWPPLFTKTSPVKILFLLLAPADSKFIARRCTGVQVLVHSSYSQQAIFVHLGLFTIAVQSYVSIMASFCLQIKAANLIYTGVRDGRSHKHSLDQPVCIQGYFANHHCCCTQMHFNEFSSGKVFLTHYLNPSLSKSIIDNSEPQEGPGVSTVMWGHNLPPWLRQD